MWEPWHSDIRTETDTPGFFQVSQFQLVSNLQSFLSFSESVSKFQVLQLFQDVGKPCSLIDCSYRLVSIQGNAFPLLSFFWIPLSAIMGDNWVISPVGIEVGDVTQLVGGWGGVCLKAQRKSVSGNEKRSCLFVLRFLFSPSPVFLCPLSLFLTVSFSLFRSESLCVCLSYLSSQPFLSPVSFSLLLGLNQVMCSEEENCLVLNESTG